MAIVQSARLLTAEEFGDMPDPGYPTELFEGKVVALPQPKPRHGKVCARVGYLLVKHADEHDLGQVMSNDTGVITERDPDTVRGADVSFYSYARVPRGPLPNAYLPVPPELVVEVLSPDDRWPRTMKKVGEYLNVGVLMIVVLDPELGRAHVFASDAGPRMLGADDELTMPGVLGEFRVQVGRFFE